MERDLPLPDTWCCEGEGWRGAGAAEGEGSFRVPALPQAPTSCLPCVQNVLELTLYDKDVVGSDELSVLLFDLKSLKPGQPHRHTFPLNQQVSCPTAPSNEPSSSRGRPARGTEEGSQLADQASKTEPPSCTTDPTEGFLTHSFPQWN